MAKELNVYQKLQQCRVELKTLPIKESGNNKFAGYTYMELGDFLPYIVDLCHKHGLCTVVSFGSSATLAVVNSDDPSQQIIFESPMSTAELKGCHAIQNLGAVETYLRRYLYVAAFDIVEHDALDSTQGRNGNDKPSTHSAVNLDPTITKRIDDAMTMDSLADVWNSIPTGLRSGYTALKNAAKERIAAYGEQS